MREWQRWRGGERTLCYCCSSPWLCVTLHLLPFHLSLWVHNDSSIVFAPRVRNCGRHAAVSNSVHFRTTYKTDLCSRQYDTPEHLESSQDAVRASSIRPRSSAENWEEASSWLIREVLPSKTYLA